MDSALSVPPEIEEGLRVLRRGLLRSEGFALFFAVCNTPEVRESLVRALVESLPGRSLVRVELQADTVDPLEAVRARWEARKPSNSPAVMIVVGLENAVPGDGSRVHALHSLNLRRQAWQEQVPAAVVFWIPSYLAGLLGTHAADFFAWRRDVVEFPVASANIVGHALEPGRTESGFVVYMERSRRQRRLDELVSRLKMLSASDDATAAESRAQWQAEAAEHLWFLGRAEEAETMLGRALSHWQTAGNRRAQAVALGQSAEVLAILGRSGEAETKLREAFAHFKRLAESDPANAGWQRDLSVSFNKLGDLATAQGKLPEAERHFAQAHAIRQRLAESDPANAGWRRDLSISFNKLGDLATAQGKLPEAERHFAQALAIAQRLAESDPANAGAQRDLSVSFNKLGDLATAQGKLAEAERHFAQALAIAQRLVESDPANAGWQRDLSVSLTLLAELNDSRGELRAALALAEQSFVIGERLASLDSTNVTWQRDVRVSRELVTRLRARIGET